MWFSVRRTRLVQMFPLDHSELTLDHSGDVKVSQSELLPLSVCIELCCLRPQHRIDCLLSSLSLS